MLKQFPPVRDYSSLSVKDLLDARSAYHLHLSHLSNVVATAIGKYRIHRDDWSAEHSPRVSRPGDFKPVTSEKTVYNTVTRSWSWPCVLVFVNCWVDREKFAKSPDQMVPRVLFLPDGRVVPTCVLLVEERDTPAAAPDTPSFPRSLIGGGFALTSSLQGRERLGSVGCLVTDGHLTYGLTNRHVAGELGEEISSVLRGNLERIGVSAGKELRKKPFNEVYPGWQSENAFANLDIGLIRLDDLNRWTTQIAGLGPLNMPLDLTTDNISLDLIDQTVRAFGGASGALSGSICALFYRYKSVGGSDYIADLLIAPDEGLVTRPGDSGTVWCANLPTADSTDADPKNELRPIAVEWGGHVIVDDRGGKKSARAFALATFLSTVCRELDVDVVRDWNSGLPEYWGDVGHYTIGAKACQLFSHNDELSSLMMANLDRIAYRDENIQPKTFKGLSKEDFVPLADVPDKVWKMHGQGARGQPEHPNHFADMDKQVAGGKSLLEITSDGRGGTDMEKVTIATFESYYDEVKDKSRGLLPFRVWQLYDLMVTAASKDDPVEFIAAAGVMAHYIGDACQPLHISYKFNGNPDDEVPGKDRNGKPVSVPRGTGVHEAYESSMLNRHAPEMLELLNAVLGILPGKQGTHGFTSFAASGHEAAVSVVDLMRKAFETISPDDIIETFVSEPEKLWEMHGQQTVELLAEGARYLAMIWESAWKQGGGRLFATDPVSPEALSEKYLDKGWAPSVTLDKIGALLSPGGDSADEGPSPRRTKNRVAQNSGLRHAG